MEYLHSSSDLLEDDDLRSLRMDALATLKRRKTRHENRDIIPKSKSTSAKLDRGNEPCEGQEINVNKNRKFERNESIRKDEIIRKKYRSVNETHERKHIRLESKDRYVYDRRMKYREEKYISDKTENEKNFKHSRGKYVTNISDSKRSHRRYLQEIPVVKNRKFERSNVGKKSAGRNGNKQGRMICAIKQHIFGRSKEFSKEGKSEEKVFAQKVAVHKNKKLQKKRKNKENLKMVSSLLEKDIASNNDVHPKLNSVISSTSETVSLKSSCSPRTYNKILADKKENNSFYLNVTEMKDKCCMTSSVIEEKILTSTLLDMDSTSLKPKEKPVNSKSFDFEYKGRHKRRNNGPFRFTRYLSDSESSDMDF